MLSPSFLGQVDRLSLRLFSTECDLVLFILISNILSFLKVNQ
jgi:hypothetical protein